MATSSSERARNRGIDRFDSERAAYLLPRVAITVVFLGFGVWELFDPQFWAVYVPAALSGQAWTLRLVQLHGLALATTGAAVLLPRYAKWGAVAATLLLGEICLDILLANGFTSILLRDVGLLVLAGALIWLPHPAAADARDPR